MNIEEQSNWDVFRNYIAKNYFSIILIVGFIILSLIFRLVYLLTWSEFGYDEAWTILRVDELVNEPDVFWSQTNQPPLSIVVYFIWSLIFGANYTSFRSFSLLLGILFGLIILICFLKKYPERKLALIILAISLSIDWTLLYHFKIGDINSVTIFIGMVCFLGIVLASKKDTIWSHALVGLCYGIAMLTKWSLVFLIFPYIIEFIFTLIPKKGKTFDKIVDPYKVHLRKRIFRAATALATFLVIFLPYFIFIVLNGNFAYTLSFHSERLTKIQFSFIKYFIIYSPFMFFFGLVGLIPLWQKKNEYYSRFLLFTLSSLIWLLIVPSYTDFATIHVFAPFIALEGINYAIIFLTPSKPIFKPYSKIIETSDDKDENLTSDGKTSLTTKINNFRKKYKMLLISIFIIGLLFPTSYLIYRFYDNSHEPKMGLVNSANFINNQIEITPLLPNELIVLPLAGGLLLNTSNWISQYYVVGDNESRLKDLLYNNLTYFCLNTEFAKKESAQISIIFDLALENSSLFIIDKTFEMELLTSFDNLYYIYKVISY